MTTCISRSLLIIGLCLILSALIIGCDNNSNPSGSGPEPRGSNWRVVQQPNFQANAVAASPTTIVALERGIGVRTSTDGHHWTRVHLGAPNVFHCTFITYSQGRFLMWGSHYSASRDDVRYSDDGLTWHQATVPANCRIEAAVANDSGWIAFSAKQVLASEDCATWSVIDTLPDCDEDSYYSCNIASVAWTGQEFVAITYNQSVLASQTGVDWEVVAQVGSPMSYFEDMIYADGKFVLVADSIYTSSDGRIWQAITVPDAQYGAYSTIAWSSTLGFMVAGYYTSALMSPDGVTWQKIERDGEAVLGFLTWWKDRFIGGYNSLYESFDAAHWEGIPETYGAPRFTGVAAGPWGFVAIAYGTAYYSATGDSWERTVNDTSMHVTSVTADRNHYYAVAPTGYYDSELSPGRADLFTSSDGITWERSLICEQCYVEKIAHVNGRLFALGSTILMSNDGGSHWNSAEAIPVSHQWDAIASNGEIYVAVGAAAIMSSTDGRTWVARTPPDAVANFVDVVWSGHEFVAVGAQGLLLGSPDGIHWNHRHYVDDSGYEYGYQLYDIIWDVNQYIIVGRHNVVLTASDMYNWTSVYPGVYDAFTSVASNGRKLVAVGTNGSIIVSP